MHVLVCIVVRDLRCVPVLLVPDPTIELVELVYTLLTSAMSVAVGAFRRLPDVQCPLNE